MHRLLSQGSKRSLLLSKVTLPRSEQNGTGPLLVAARLELKGLGCDTFKCPCRLEDAQAAALQTLAALQEDMTAVNRKKSDLSDQVE
jgi:hypothetical protein